MVRAIPLGWLSLLRSRYQGRHATLLPHCTKWGEALRDELNNGCEGNYGWPGLIRKYRSFYSGIPTGL